MSARGILIGIIAGAAAGAVLGVLFAPAKGSATRRKIARRGAEYAEEAKETFNESIDALSEEYDTLKESALDLVGKGKEKVASVVRARQAR
jgi:gas vesicle protein